MKAWNEGMTFIGRYKGVSMYSRGGAINFLFGWMPQVKQSIRAAKIAITKWRKT